MEPYTLYTPEIWERYSEKFGKTQEEFEVKTYTHLDNPFDFFQFKKEINAIVSDITLTNAAQHAFLPFVKILVKTPRYKYQENVNEYQLETKIRPIAFASHFDTYLYGFYSFALTEKYQEYIHKEGFHESILAYRTDLDGRCNIQFAKEVFDGIEQFVKTKKSCSVIALDITGYLTTLNTIY